MKRRVIIESPYSSGTPISIPAVVARNKRYARACIRDSLLRGEAPYLSHLLYTQKSVLDDTKPEERRMGMEAGWTWYSGAEAAVFYVDLGISSGMTEGRVRALEAGVTIYEERRLTGDWARCWPGDPYSCNRAGDNIPGPIHGYACPLWRAT
jgi:hypothetical protein